MSSPIPKVVPTRPGAGLKRAGDDYGVSDTPDWRDTDWQAHQHRLTAAGAEINYVDVGKSEHDRPIIFIHGLGGQWQNWLENIPPFAQHRRVIVPDLPGFGGSPMPGEKITISFYARVVADLCDQLGVGSAVVVGNSMGGFIAAELAIERPELVERLMLVSAAGISQVDVAKRPMMAITKAIGLGTAINVARLKVVARRARTRHAVLLLVARYPGSLKPDLAFEGFISGTGRAGFVSAMAACLDYDFRDRLPEIGCPTLVVWGEKDMIIPLADADRYVKAIGHARKIVMDDTGHVSMAERPITFNGYLQEFLGYRISEGELEQEEGWEEQAVKQ